MRLDIKSDEFLVRLELAKDGNNVKVLAYDELDNDWTVATFRDDGVLELAANMPKSLDFQISESGYIVTEKE